MDFFPELFFKQLNSGCEALFAADEPVWSALSRLGDFLASHFKDEWPLKGMSGQITEPIVIKEGQRLQGPFTLTAELLYQSIGYRWAENLRGFEGQELDRFTAYYNQVTNQPVMVASAVVVVGD